MLLATLIAPTVPAPQLVISSSPLLIVVVPVNVFAPPRIKMPLLVFVKPAVPAMMEVMVFVVFNALMIVGVVPLSVSKLF